MAKLSEDEKMEIMMQDMWDAINDAKWRHLNKHRTVELVVECEMCRIIGKATRAIRALQKAWYKIHA